MEALAKSLAVTMLISVHTAGAFAQNSVADQRFRAGSDVTGQARASARAGMRPPPSEPAPTERPAATAAPLIVGPSAGSGTKVPADGEVSRGGPDNPSGLKKPD
jgi:hypothetical protein